MEGLKVLQKPQDNKFSINWQAIGKGEKNILELKICRYLEIFKPTMNQEKLSLK